MKKAIVLATLIFVLGWANVAKADTISFQTPLGATTVGGAVDASATFTTGTGTVMITLTDLEANPKNVGQFAQRSRFRAE